MIVTGSAGSSTGPAPAPAGGWVGFVVIREPQAANSAATTTMADNQRACFDKPTVLLPRSRSAALHVPVEPVA